MIMDKTKVIFRKDKSNGEIFAIFPEMADKLNYRVGFYAYVGQHGEGDYNDMIKTSAPAKPEEYEFLYNHLTKDIGYNLIIRKRSKINYI